MNKYHDWLTVRMYTDGWESLGDRWEILWGPDYLGHHGLFLFEGKRMCKYFSDIPKNIKYPIMDKRMEIDSFDVEEGYRNIGISF